jgi:hypothetical protein
MCEHVIFQVRLFGEASTAELAAERPRAIVTVHVTAQIARRRKRLATLAAFVRLFLFYFKTDIYIK